jgi:S1-C subfamily serine protease
MYVKGKNRGGRVSPLPAHPSKHHKPYRIRHIGLFLAGIAAVILSAFSAGYLLGREDLAATTLTNIQPQSAKPALGEVKSGLGYSFKYDPAVFSASGIIDSNGRQQVATGKTLAKGGKLSEVTMRPKHSSVKGPDVLSELQIDADEDSGPLDRYRQKTGYDDEKEALAAYFSPQSNKNFRVEEIGRKEQKIGSIKFQRITYEQKPLFDSEAKPVFSVMWIGTYEGKPTRIYLKNLLNGSQIPSIYGQIFDTMRFGGKDVLADTIDRSPAFDINRVSPAVVKIYHFVCGTLIINEVKYGGDACDGGSGSGFFVSGDGYIATSGHVVVLDAADILVSQLLSNPALLRQFTAAAGLTSQQSEQPDAVASVLAKIYDLPPEKLRLDNRREATFVSLGNRPVLGNTQEEVKKAFGQADSDFIKKAEIVAVNFQPKDLLVIEQNNQEGFSASDVALIKVSQANSPYIRMADSTKLQQNSPISLIGFPSDADNQLTKNSNISPSVTNGTISSIREANGSSSLLFQTDADASEGSSGGPAIDKEGKAFGLVTYRFKGGNEANAAKSYIRDIADFKDMVESKNISLDVESSTQSHWEAGLDLFREERYSKAVKQFQQVQGLYPAHRLVKNYVAQAQQAILDGKDKKDPPYALIGIISTGIGGIVVAIIAGKLIIRHKKAHLAYKANHLNNRKTTAPTANSDS